MIRGLAPPKYSLTKFEPDELVDFPFKTSLNIKLDRKSLILLRVNNFMLFHQNLRTSVKITTCTLFENACFLMRSRPHFNDRKTHIFSIHNA